jgi:hypothetical protein
MPYPRDVGMFAPRGLLILDNPFAGLLSPRAAHAAALDGVEVCRRIHPGQPGVRCRPARLDRLVDARAAVNGGGPGAALPSWSGESESPKSSSVALQRIVAVPCPSQPTAA